MEKVTIYYQGFLGFTKVEAKSFEVSHMADGKVYAVNFVKKGCRKASQVSTYYCPVIKVVRGWNRPNPPTAWKPSELSETGCVVTEAKFSGCSPEWRAEFEAALQFAPEDVLVSVV